VTQTQTLQAHAATQARLQGEAAAVEAAVAAEAQEQEVKRCQQELDRHGKADGMTQGEHFVGYY